MGAHEVLEASTDDELRAFTQAVLRDLEALERMLELGMIESGVRRVGVEQEMFLVDQSGRPAPCSTEVLEKLGDPRLTTELALFNLEANLPPQPFDGGFLRTMEENLAEVVARTDRAARAVGARVLLTGILPSLRRDDLDLHNMTPVPRYRRLNDALLRLRGGAFSIFIRGVDELEETAHTVMLESANTSFQLHLQVGPREMAPLYNLVQLVTAPLLAAAVNSPVLFGRRLWRETRVALFERSVDARSRAELARGKATRVSFGNAWLRESVVEIFQDTAARFRPALTCEVDADPLESVESGVAPPLPALMLHNGTVWRWNRPCYGVADGKAHLRIENRVLPAGPTVLDAVANAALFYGLVAAYEEMAPEIPSRLHFDDAKANFVIAARQGLGARLTWLDGVHVGARELLLGELLPAARRGLESVGVPAAEVERYLGTVEQRVDTGRTGARWILASMAELRDVATPEACAMKLSEAMLHRQGTGDPVHQWPIVSRDEVAEPRRAFRTVADVMSTDIFTVRPGDVVDLATSMMDWRHFRHVPVENDEGQLVGIVSHHALLRLGQRKRSASAEPVAIEAIMEPPPAQVAPDTPLVDALQQMLDTGRGCLVVINSRGRLVGLVTERDFLRAAARLLAGSS